MHILFKLPISKNNLQNHPTFFIHIFHQQKLIQPHHKHKTYWKHTKIPNIYIAPHNSTNFNTKQYLNAQPCPSTRFFFGPRVVVRDRETMGKPRRVLLCPKEWGKLGTLRTLVYMWVLFVCLFVLDGGFARRGNPAAPHWRTFVWQTRRLPIRC